MTEATFTSYGKDFQEKILQSLIADPVWSAQMYEVMTYDYFDLGYLQFLCSKHFEHYEKYKAFPSMGNLVSMVKESLSSEGKDKLLKDQIVEYLTRIKANPNWTDLPYVKEKSLDFCKRQSLQKALEKSVVAIKDENYDSVLEIIKDALSRGNPNTVGHDFFEDADARFAQIKRVVCPTGHYVLDEKNILNGGLGIGELGVVMAPTGVGKSHFLVNMGASALKVGKNVVHYTFELSENVTALRYDSHFTGIEASDVIDEKDQVLEHYKNNQYGRLIIKYFPVGTASTVTLKNHLEKLLMRNFVPSMIVIDYADNMISAREAETTRHGQKQVYEEVRNLAGEMRIPIWTACQTNRSGVNSDIVSVESIGESFAKAAVADFIMSISRKESEKSTGSGRVSVLKNRMGRDGYVFPCKIDTARSRFDISEQLDDFSAQELYNAENSGAKSALKNAWKKVNEDPGL